MKDVFLDTFVKVLLYQNVCLYCTYVLYYTYDFKGQVPERLMYWILCEIVSKTASSTLSSNLRTKGFCICKQSEQLLVLLHNGGF
jgi:hypothetical protein